MRRRGEFNEPVTEPKAMLIWVKLAALIGMLVLVIWMIGKLNEFSSQPSPTAAPPANAPGGQSFEVQIEPLTTPANTTPASAPKPAPAAAPSPAVPAPQQSRAEPPGFAPA